MWAFAVLSLAAAADKRPNFSGAWKLNGDRSALGPIPVPSSLIRTVTHSDPSLTIREEQKGGSGDHVFTRRYTTNGKEVTFLENGANAKARASWEGNTLVIESHADAGGIGILFVEKMTVLDGGNTLTDAIHVITPQGEFDATYWFERR